MTSLFNIDTDLKQKILFSPHLKLNLVLPEHCSKELFEIEDYYGLSLSDKISESRRIETFKTSMGHALRSYAPKKEYAYYTKGSKSLKIDKEWEYNNKFYATDTWYKCPKTTNWIVTHLCEEEDLGMVCLHKIKKGGYVDFHTHCDVYPYTLGIVHISIMTNELDLSIVKDERGELHSMNYPLNKSFLFNGYLQHRSTNFSNSDRIHLVIECSFKNKKFLNLIKNAV